MTVVAVLIRKWKLITDGRRYFIFNLETDLPRADQHKFVLTTFRTWSTKSNKEFG